MIVLLGVPDIIWTYIYKYIHVYVYIYIHGFLICGLGVKAHVE